MPDSIRRLFCVCRCQGIMNRCMFSALYFRSLMASSPSKARVRHKLEHVDGHQPGKPQCPTTLRSVRLQEQPHLGSSGSGGSIELHSNDDPGTPSIHQAESRESKTSLELHTRYWDLPSWSSSNSRQLCLRFLDPLGEWLLGMLTFGPQMQSTVRLSRISLGA